MRVRAELTRSLARSPFVSIVTRLGTVQYSAWLFKPSVGYVPQVCSACNLVKSWCRSVKRREEKILSPPQAGILSFLSRVRAGKKDIARAGNIAFTFSRDILHSSSESACLFVCLSAHPILRFVLFGSANEEDEVVLLNMNKFPYSSAPVPFFPFSVDRVVSACPEKKTIPHRLLDLLHYLGRPRATPQDPKQSFPLS